MKAYLKEPVKVIVEGEQVPVGTNGDYLFILILLINRL